MSVTYMHYVDTEGECYNSLLTALPTYTCKFKENREEIMKILLKSKQIVEEEMNLDVVCFVRDSHKANPCSVNFASNYDIKFDEVICVLHTLSSIVVDIFHCKRQYVFRNYKFSKTLFLNFIEKTNINLSDSFKELISSIRNSTSRRKFSIE